MKTNYLQRSRPRRRSGYYKVAIAALLVLVIGAGALTLLRGGFTLAATPVWKGQNALVREASILFSWFGDKDSLARENLALRERIASQEAELMSLRSIKKREEELLSMFGRSPEGQKILSSVLIRPPETPYDILVLDAGKREGVQAGSKVVLPEGPLLGTVVEAYERTSRVKLFTSHGEKSGAVLERTGTPVILLGQGGGNFRLTLPRELEVKEGDRILSAGSSAELIAVVSKVNMAPTDSFKEVLAQGVSNIFTIRYVLVLP